MTPALSREPAAHQARRYFWVTASLVALALLTTVAAAFPANVLKPSNSGALILVSKLAPQGWAFFTKDPQDVELVAYAPTSHGLNSLQTTPQSRVENAWGITRAQRAQGPEIAALSNELTWMECVPGEVPEACVDTEATFEPVLSPVPHPSLCGKVLVVQEKPVAWSFREFVHGTHTAERIAYALVDCDGGDE